MDDVRVVSRAKFSAADIVISPAFRLSSVRLDSPPAHSLATGRPPGGVADLPEAWHRQQRQLPASDPLHQPGTSSWPCSSRAWSSEAERNSGSLARVLDCQGMMKSVMVGRVSDMQESPPRGSPHRQACPRRDSHCEALK